MIRRHAAATIVAAVVAAAIAFAIVVVTGDAGADGVYHRPTRPAPIGVFRDGGTPRRDAAIERVLELELPAVVVTSVAISGQPIADEPARQRAIAALRASSAFGGGALADAWRALIDSLDRWMPFAPNDPAFRRRSDELHARVDVVSDQLAAAGLGYYLDPEILDEHARRRAGIFAYRIDDVAFVRAGDDRVRVLGLRRLDHVATGAALLGMMTEELGDPVVLLDAVDDKVRNQILPVLAGRAYPIGDAAWASSGRGRAAAIAAGDAIRAELMTALGDDVGSVAAASARCERLIAASVRHHEAQHGLDHASGLDQPHALAIYVGEAKSTPFATRARFELSAYVSQIASDVWLPQLVLWNLARHGFRDAPTRSEEQLVAIVVIEGLARRLGIASPGPVIHGGAIDRDRLAALVAPIAARSTAELRSAAAALWAELFGGKLGRIVDI